MAEDSEKSLISLRKAGKIYGTVTALKKIDLDIYKGQMGQENLHFLKYFLCRQG